MTLPETYEIVRPSIVALGSKLVKLENGQVPLFPIIYGTGFFVDERGIIVTNRHVAEILQQLPCHPQTGKPAAFALIAGQPTEAEGMHSLSLLFVEIKGYSFPNSFTKKGPSYGEAIPDIAFLQLNVRDAPILRLTTDFRNIRPGTPVATAGFPLGEDALVVYEKLVQVTPFLRQGVVSSLHLFPCLLPDGFTMDILMQGGGSGSPIFLTDAPLVVGIVYAGFPNVNITLALPSTIINAALKSCLNAAVLDIMDVPTLQDLYENSPSDEGPKWETFVV